MIQNHSIKKQIRTGRLSWLPVQFLLLVTPIRSKTCQTAKTFCQNPLLRAAFGQNKTLKLCQNNIVINIASPSHTPDNWPVESPPLHKSGHPHRTNPVSDVPSCRSNSGEPYHNNHKPFFLGPLKLDNPCPGVSKYPPNICSRTISGEPIFVQQSSPFFHLLIVQDFLSK